MSESMQFLHSPLGLPTFGPRGAMSVIGRDDPDVRVSGHGGGKDLEVVRDTDSSLADGPVVSVSDGVLQLVDQLRARGFSHAEVRDMVVGGKPIGVAAGEHAGALPPRVVRLREFFSDSDRLAREEGFCYLWLVRPGKRREASERFGLRPRLRTLFSLPQDWLALDAWKDVQLRQVGPLEFHLERDVGKGGVKWINAVAATDQGFPGLLPVSWRRAVRGVVPSGPLLPVVSVLGASAPDKVVDVSDAIPLRDFGAGIAEEPVVRIEMQDLDDPTVLAVVLYDEEVDKIRRNLKGARCAVEGLTVALSGAVSFRRTVLVRTSYDPEGRYNGGVWLDSYRSVSEKRSGRRLVAQSRLDWHRLITVEGIAVQRRAREMRRLS